MALQLDLSLLKLKFDEKDRHEVIELLLSAIKMAEKRGRPKNVKKNVLSESKQSSVIPSPRNSQTQSKTKSSSTKPTKSVSFSHTCPICDDEINDEKHDSVHCDGSCQTWLHRGCAGLSTKKFAAMCVATVPDQPFYCVSCQLTNQSRDLEALKLSHDKQAKDFELIKQYISTLSSELTQLKDQLPVSQAGGSSDVFDVTQSSYQHRHTPKQKQSVPRRGPAASNSTTSQDRKFNVIIFGIDEAPAGTPRFSRIKHDSSQITTIINSLDCPDINQSVRDHFRLGKFLSSATRPRPVKVCLTKSSDVATLLLKRNKNLHPVYIHPDRSPDQRKAISILNDNRRSLIKSGTDPLSVKIRGFSLLVDNQSYGYIHNSKFVLATSKSPLNNSLDSVESHIDADVENSQNSQNTTPSPPPSVPSSD